MKPLFAILHRMLIKNWSLKLLAFAFAIGLWIFVSVGQTVLEIPKRVALELRNVPPQLVRTSDVPGHVEIKVLGSNAQLRGIDDEKLSYELDLANATPGNLSFKVIQTRIKNLPSSVKVTEINPSEINIKFSERVEKTVPVEVITTGEPARGYLVEEKRAEPPLVRVSGAREEVENMASIATEIIDVTGLREPYHGQHALDVVGRHIDLVERQDVDVDVIIARDLVQREFSKIAVTVANTALDWAVAPKVLDLRLKGPAEAMRALSPDNIRLVIDAEGMSAGTHKVRPQVRVPGEEDMVLIGLELPDVELRLEEPKKK
ncbi:MAG: CdaR family protein [Deltaproteobacteria bacterium]|nr:CdaR family protein [Deltaproteobacteria bacterium]